MLRATCVGFARSLLTLPPAAGLPCDEPWGERDAISHDAGSRFGIRRGIAAIGSTGGKDDGPRRGLSPAPSR